MSNRLYSFFYEFSRKPNEYIVKALSFLHIVFFLPLPATLLVSDLDSKRKVIYLVLWSAMICTSLFLMKSRTKNVLRDAFEAGFYCVILTLFYFKLGMTSYLITGIFINLSIFCLMISFRCSVNISFFQAVIYLFMRVLFLEMEGDLIDNYIPGFLFCGIGLGVLGNIQRISFQKTKLLENSRIDTVKAFIEAIETKDTYTSGHSIKVSMYCRQIGEKLGLPEDEVKDIEEAALLHDIGKIGISDAILNKKGPLTPEEFGKIQNHPSTGSKILSNVKNISRILPYIESHHERVDGGGYPEGLKNEEIPFGARILCVADAYDAMTSDRPYRKALPEEEAVKRLRGGSGTQFSPEIVNAFIAILEGRGKEKTPSKEVSNKNKVTKKPFNLPDIFNINSLTKKVHYGLVVIVLLPILLGITYVTGVTLYNIEKLHTDRIDVETNSFYLELDREMADLERTLTDYSYLQKISGVEGLNINYFMSSRLFKYDDSLTDIANLNDAIFNIADKAKASNSTPSFYGRYKHYSLGILPQRDIVTRNNAGYFLVNYTYDAINKAKENIITSALLTGILAIVLLLALSTYLHNIIILPLEEISSEISVASNTLSTMNRKQAKDEIGTIVREFNKLITSLRQKSKK